MRRKGVLITLLFLWIYLVGMGILLYPAINAHLEEVDREANRMLEQLTTQMAQEQGVTEELKAQDQMLWVQRMNNIRQAAEEIIYNQLIYT